MAECSGEGVVITPPNDPTLIERFGYQEIEISKVDENDDTVSVIVLGRLEEG